MEIKNLTPHAIKILNEEDEVVRVIEPEGEVARAESTEEPAGDLDGIPVTKTVLGDPVNLPEPKEDVAYVVSYITAQAAERVGRTTDDLYSPGNLVRDENGRVLGCRSLNRN